MNWKGSFYLATSLWFLSQGIQLLLWLTIAPFYAFHDFSTAMWACVSLMFFLLVVGIFVIPILTLLLKICSNQDEEPSGFSNLQKILQVLFIIIFLVHLALWALIWNLGNDNLLTFFLLASSVGTVASVLLHVKKIKTCCSTNTWEHQHNEYNEPNEYNEYNEHNQNEHNQINENNNTSNHKNLNFQNKQNNMEQLPSDEQQSFTPVDNTPSVKRDNSILIKGGIIGVLILLMLIPVSFIIELVAEREKIQEEVKKEVSSKWASSQTISGPLLVVPYMDNYTNDDGKTVAVERNAYFLPLKLDINGELMTEVRKRSIYEVVLYTSDLLLKGVYEPIDPAVLELDPKSFLYEKAHILLGISDSRGLEENIALDWGGKQTEFVPTAKNEVMEGRTLKAPVSLATHVNVPESENEMRFPFSIHLKLKGSGSFFFAPSAVSTAATLRSSWKDPAFTGNFLTASKPEVSDSGFVANWKLLGQNTGLPQCWKGETFKLNDAAFGVNLVQPTDGYSKTMRSAKYAILFVGLTFSLFFFIEILQKKSVHPVQYVLIGIALSVFYTLLLSFSEYFNFDIAYLIATVATVSLITLYAKGVFHKWKLASLFGGVLSMLYFFIYILLQAQDNALMLGSIGLFIVLSVIMYFSRRVNWYGAASQIKSSEN